MEEKFSIMCLKGTLYFHGKIDSYSLWIPQDSYYPFLTYETLHLYSEYFISFSIFYFIWYNLLCYVWAISIIQMKFSGIACKKAFDVTKWYWNAAHSFTCLLLLCPTELEQSNFLKIFFIFLCFWQPLQKIPQIHPAGAPAQFFVFVFMDDSQKKFNWQDNWWKRMAMIYIVCRK